ncbi:hypothetical protein B0H16DRAFT_1466392 [Mycena metata]|uniref:Uncharacterized protein n=1 Tax=Mycena metata TaxID=1033252 RepID=A0AAD7MY42_9AGAR|nr:hypothetical protein B0H16DRAFT_1466392 [Mycena metata]
MPPSVRSFKRTGSDVSMSSPLPPHKTARAQSPQEDDDAAFFEVASRSSKNAAENSNVKPSSSPAYQVKSAAARREKRKDPAVKAAKKNEVLAATPDLDEDLADIWLSQISSRVDRRDSYTEIMSRFDSNLIVPTPSETVAKQEHTDKITADEAPETESEREETPEPEPTPEKGYGLSMELVEFEDLNYDNEIFDTPEDQQEQIFGLPEDQDEQTFSQESAEGNNSEVSEEEMPEPESTPESRSRAQLQEWLDALEQITFGSQAGDIEAGNQLRQRLAELEQKNQAAEQGITEDIDPEVEDVVDAQNDKGDNEIAERAQVEVLRRPQASKIVEAPRRLNYIMLPEEVPRTEPVKGKNWKEIDNLF